MVRTFGVGVIGMGWMGQVHSRSYLEFPSRFQDAAIRPRLVICADDVEKRARAGQELFGFERHTTDWRAVATDPDVDVVNITAPNNMHLEIVRAAAEADKHIFCEKPVGRGPQETAEIEMLARHPGVLTGVGFNYRHAPVVQHGLQLLREGRLGDLTHYRGRFFTDYGRDPRTVLSWRFRRDVAGLGALGDVGSHVIDMALMLAGPIKRVVADHRTFIHRRPLPERGEGTHFTKSEGEPVGEVTNEDSVIALVEFEGGAFGSLEACRVIKGAQSHLAFELNGTRGAMSWDGQRPNELELYLAEEGPAHDGPTRIRSGPQHPFHGAFYPAGSLGLDFDALKVIEAYRFSKSIVEGRQGEPGFQEALAVAGVQDAIMRSWKADSWQDVKSLRIG